MISHFYSTMIPTHKRDPVLLLPTPAGASTIPIKRGPAAVSMPPPIKRSVGRPPKPADDRELLNEKFGLHEMENLGFNERYKSKGSNLPHFTLKYLRENLYFKLNNSMPLDCYLTSNGSLAVFNIPDNDIDVLNRLLRFLCKKVNFDSTKHQIVEMDKNVTHFVRVDRLSSFWNSEGKTIANLPTHSFTARINLKVIGLVVQKNGVNTVKLLYHIDQVKVEKELNNMADAHVECVFE